MAVNTNTLIVSLPTDRFGRIFNMVSHSARLLSHFLGKLNTAKPAVALAPLFFRYLQQNHHLVMLARDNKDYKTLLSPSCQAREKLVQWQEHLFKYNGKPLKQKLGQMVIQSVIQSDAVIQLDASLSGWEALRRGKHKGGGWSIQEQTMHLICLKLLAVTLVVKGSRSLNTLGSAISSVHDQAVGMAAGQHPTICRLLEGAFHS